MNSTFDAVDANPGDGICASSAEECTLSAAVMEGNALPGHDTIRLGAATYPAGFSIYDSLSIIGEGAGLSFIDGQDTAWMSIEAGNFELSDVTIRRSRLEASNQGGVHAIHRSSFVSCDFAVFTLNSSVNISESVFRDNVTAIESATGSYVSISATTIADNATGIRGGNGPTWFIIEDTDIVSNQTGINLEVAESHWCYA